MSKPESNVQEKVERRLAKLKEIFNPEDQNWMARWARGTDALRYPNQGPNDPGPESGEDV